MKKTLIILNIAGLLGALIWLMVDKDWEPLITSIGLIGALIAQLSSDKNSSKNLVMKQKGGKNSKNYQSKGNIKITNNDKR